jgi:hypothetical protein
VVDGTIVEQVSGDGFLNDLCDDLFPQVLSRDLLSMLSGDDNGVHTNGDRSTSVHLVLDGDLSLGIRS